MKRQREKRQDRTDDSGFILLARFPELWQADLAVSLLASEGIRAWSADERVLYVTDHSADMSGAGVVVREADAMSAWNILQMAERGELSLAEETVESSDEWNKRKIEEQVQESLSSVFQSEYTPSPFAYKDAEPENGLLRVSRNPETGTLPVIRCPRCGSENNEKKRGIKALLSPGYRCRVCRWEWRGNQNLDSRL